MKSVLLASVLLACMLLAACAPAPIPNTQTAAITEAVRDIVSAPADPTAAPTAVPLTHLDLWLTAKDDPTAPPVTQMAAHSVSTLYMWAIVTPGITGDFTLEATLQDGTKKQLGQTFHAAPDGAIIPCGSWKGIFLSTKGTVQLQAYAGDVLLGSAYLSID